MTNQEKIQLIRFEFGGALFRKCTDAGFDVTVAAIIAELIKSDVQQLAYELALRTKDSLENMPAEQPKTETPD